MSDGGKIVIKTGLDNSGVEKDWAAMSAMITKGAAVIGAAMVAATTAVIGLGSAYETSAAKASTLFGNVEVDTVGLNKNILDLSSSSGVAAKELNETLYQAMSAGVAVTKDMGAALDAVEQANKLAVGGFTTSASAIDVMTTAANAYSDAGYNMSQISDILVTVQNKGKTTVDELASSLGRVLPVASAYSVSLEDVGAAEAIMTANGIATAESTTYLKGMLNELGNSGSVVSGILQDKTGMSFAQLMESGKSLGDIMGTLKDSVDGDTTAFANLWSSQEAGVGALSIANAGTQTYSDTLDAMKDSAGTTEDAYSKMSDTLSFKVGKIKESAKNLGIAVYQDMQEPLKDAADVVIDIFGDMASALPGAINKVKPVIRTFTSTMNLLLDNLDVIVPTVASAVAAIAAFKIVEKVSKWYKTASAASIAYASAMAAEGVVANASSVAHLLLASTMSATELVVGVLTGKVSLATAAQVAWNAVMSANPAGLVVTAVTALSAGLIALTVVLDHSKEKHYELTEEQQKVIDKSNEEVEAIKSQHEAREQSVQAIDREYAGYETLLSELQSITDENGNVKAGYEDRAKVITGELSSALGIEIEMLDGQIRKYGEVVASIKEVITQKKAEALLSSMQDDMAKAYENSAKALEAYKDAAAVAADKKKDLEEAQKRVNAVEEQWGNNTGPAAISAQTEANQALEKAQDAYDDASASMTGAKNSLEDLTAEVNNYDALMEAVASGDTARIESAMNALVTSYRTYTSEALASSEETRQSLYDQANGYAENIKLIQDGTVQVADSVYEETARAARNTLNNFNQLPGGIAEGIRAIGPEAGAAMLSALADANLDGKLDAEGKQDIETFISSFSGLDAETQAVWSQAWYGALKGLEGFEGLADPATEGADVFLESLRAALEVHSPSAAVEAIFAQVWPGASSGLDQGKEELSTRGSGAISEFLAGLTSGGLLEGAKGIGQSVMQFFGVGVSSQTGTSQAAGRANADAANQGAGSVNPTGIGSLFSSLFGSGISGAKGLLSSAGNTIAAAAKSAAGGVNPSGEGTRFSTVFGAGISSGSRSAKSNAERMASGAKDKLSVDTQSSGGFFSSGFANGIIGGIGSAVSAAANLASSALNKIKSTLGINSPAKKTIEAGSFTGEGFALGIARKEKAVKEASGKLTSAALNGLDCDAITANMQATVVKSNLSISSSLSARVKHSVVDNASEKNDSLDVLARKTAGYLVEGLKNSGIAFVVDDTEIARLEGGVFSV